MKKFLITSLALLLLFNCVNAQTPVVPKGVPGKPSLPSPKVTILLKPDLQFVSANLIGVEEMTERHLFKIKLSITYKNAGNAATAKGYSLDLQNFFPGRSGGTNHVIVGSPCTLHQLAAGAARTEEWWFIKDINELGRGKRQFMVRIDCTNSIDESNETNNNSPVFDIDLH